MRRKFCTTGGKYIHIKSGLTDWFSKRKRKKEEHMRLRENIKAFLKRHGISVSELSRRCGVPNATLADWINGRNPNNLMQLKKLADYMNLTIDALIFGEETTLEAKLNDEWISGIYEIKLRRIDKREDKE